MSEEAHNGDWSGRETSPGKPEHLEERPASHPPSVSPRDEAKEEEKPKVHMPAPGPPHMIPVPHGMTYSQVPSHLLGGEDVEVYFSNLEHPTATRVASSPHAPATSVPAGQTSGTFATLTPMQPEDGSPAATPSNGYISASQMHYTSLETADSASSAYQSASMYVAPVSRPVISPHYTSQAVTSPGMWLDSTYSTPLTPGRYSYPAMDPAASYPIHKAPTGGQYSAVPYTTTDLNQWSTLSGTLLPTAGTQDAVRLSPGQQPYCSLQSIHYILPLASQFVNQYAL